VRAIDRFILSLAVLFTLSAAVLAGNSSTGVGVNLGLSATELSARTGGSLDTLSVLTILLRTGTALSGLDAHYAVFAIDCLVLALLFGAFDRSIRHTLERLTLYLFVPGLALGIGWRAAMIIIEVMTAT
jgi:hypothetical protein